MHAPKKSFGEYLFVVVTLLLGVAASGWLAFAEHRAEISKAHSSFTIAASDRINVITQAMKNNLAAGHAVAALFRASDNVSREEFSEFASQLRRDYPSIEALEWAPLVPADQREAYEQAGGFPFLDITSSGELAVAAPRDVYFPVYYVEPTANYTSHVLGVDFATHPVRKMALERAIETRQTTASAKVTLLSSQLPGVLFFSPIIKSNQVTGLAVTVAPLDTIIASAIERLNKEGVNIIAYDITFDTSRSTPLFVHHSRLKPATEEEIVQSYQTSALRHTATIDIAQRKWEITVLPSAGYYITDNNDAIIILIGGLVFTILLCTYMVSRIRESVRTSEMVELRTRELHQTKNEVELILHSTGEGILGIDRIGVIDFVNPVAGEILGYTKHELIGKNFSLFFTREEDQGLILELLQRGGEARNVETMFKRKNGSTMQVEFSASAMMEVEGVTGAVMIFRDISARKHYEQELVTMARYDQLTGLANRRLFFNLVQKSLAHAKRAHNKLAILYFDLNDFKPVNDEMGHAAGDALLKEFALRIGGTLREEDIFARLGGDEFAVLADHLHSEADCAALLERICESLTQPFTIHGTDLFVSASIGIALYPDHADNVDNLIARADAAMYEAKRDKGRKYVFATAA